MFHLDGREEVQLNHSVNAVVVVVGIQNLIHPGIDFFVSIVVGVPEMNLNALSNIIKY